jgi:radical SAM superfamily enzyme YgiQ (UPF0313 family)
MRILLITYDNGSLFHGFPMGLGCIARVLVDRGYDVDVWSQDIHHYPDEDIPLAGYDAVCISVVGGYYQYRKLMSLGAVISGTPGRPLFVIGGHGPSPEPEYFLLRSGADVCVMGEGEGTVGELFDCIAWGRSFAHVKGIAYRVGGDVFVNPRRELLDVDAIGMPAYELFPMEYYRLYRRPRMGPTDFCMQVLSGRGCTFKCNFCYRMDEGFRPRSVEGIVEEVGYLKGEYGITRVAFEDELLMSSVARTEEVCRALAPLGVEWDCNGRLNYAKPDVLKLMRESGCVFINYGIESYDDGALKRMNKGLTTKQITLGIEATLAEGISPGFNIIWGNLGEDEEILGKGVEFLLKYDDGAQRRTIRPVTPYPGSALYYEAIERGLLGGMVGEGAEMKYVEPVEDFYENRHLNSDLLAVNFTGLTDDEFHKALLRANTRLLENYYDKQKAAAIEQAERLYAGDTSFRGFR